MRNMRFSIAGLMGFVVVAALGFGGLKASDESWASGCYTLLVAALVVAVITAFQSIGRKRAYWAGFAIAGSVYFGFVFGTLGTSKVTPPQFLTELLFDRLEAMVHPTGLGITFGTITVSSVTGTSGAAPATPAPATFTYATTGSVGTPPPLSPPSTVSPPISLAAPPAPPMFMMPATIMSRVHFSQVAHSLTAMLVGMAGGYYAAWLFVRRERRETSTAPELTPSSP
jgi:hypothetical protein